MNSIIASPLPDRKEILRAIRQELAARHAAELRAASLWRRWLLRWRIERETRVEFKRRFPPGALYGAGV